MKLDSKKRNKIKIFIFNKSFFSGMFLFIIFLTPGDILGYDTSSVTLQHRLFGILLGVLFLCMALWKVRLEENK